MLARNQSSSAGCSHGVTTAFADDKAPKTGFNVEHYWRNSMKALFTGILICLLSVGALAAEGHDVTYQSGAETVHALLYMPSTGNGPFPALVVIHEWWGLNDWVKQQASALADEGYETLAIDLYRGKVATTPDLAHELMRGVPDDRAARDLHEAVVFLQAQPDVK